VNDKSQRNKWTPSTQLAAPSAMNLMFVQQKRPNYQAQNLSAVGAWMLFLRLM
jgi:hypothetical protein